MVRVSRQPIAIYSYLDYRVFLRAWYDHAKKTQRGFSFRAFSAAAGFASPNFLKLVIEGDRNLTEESLAKCARGLALNKQETEYFRHLVHYTQAENTEIKNAAYERLLSTRKYSDRVTIDRSQFDYYSAWYHPVVRELVTAKDCDGTAASIARRLRPQVTPAQVERSLELLQRLGFIERGPHGRWRQASVLLSTGPEVKSHLVMRYHQHMLDLTKVVLDTVPPAQRDISTMTLGVSKARLPELKRMVRAFRKEVLELVAADTNPEVVLQLNTQLFPVVRTSEGDEQ